MSGSFPANEKNGILMEFPTLKDAFAFSFFKQLTLVAGATSFPENSSIFPGRSRIHLRECGSIRPEVISCKSDVESRIKGDVELCEAQCYAPSREIAYVGNWNRYQLI